MILIQSYCIYVFDHEYYFIDHLQKIIMIYHFNGKTDKQGALKMETHVSTVVLTIL